MKTKEMNNNYIRAQGEGALLIGTNGPRQLQCSLSKIVRVPTSYLTVQASIPCTYGYGQQDVTDDYRVKDAALQQETDVGSEGRNNVPGEMQCGGGAGKNQEKNRWHFISSCNRIVLSPNNG